MIVFAFEALLFTACRIQLASNEETVLSPRDHWELHHNTFTPSLPPVLGACEPFFLSCRKTQEEHPQA
jgi:hypothetical protein